MNKTTLYELAAIVTLISAGFAAYKWWNNSHGEMTSTLLANTENLRTDVSAAVFPASSPTDSLFSNYGRRVDLSAPLDLADQPMLYGQSIPV